MYVYLNDRTSVGYILKKCNLNPNRQKLEERKTVTK